MEHTSAGICDDGRLWALVNKGKDKTASKVLSVCRVGDRPPPKPDYQLEIVQREPQEGDATSTKAPTAAASQAPSTALKLELPKGVALDSVKVAVHPTGMRFSVEAKSVEGHLLLFVGPFDTELIPKLEVIPKFGAGTKTPSFTDLDRDAESGSNNLVRVTSEKPQRWRYERPTKCATKVRDSLRGGALNFALAACCGSCLVHAQVCPHR